MAHLIRKFAFCAQRDANNFPATLCAVGLFLPRTLRARIDICNLSFVCSAIESNRRGDRQRCVRFKEKWSVDVLRVLHRERGVKCKEKEREMRREREGCGGRRKKEKWEERGECRRQKFLFYVSVCGNRKGYATIFCLGLLSSLPGKKRSLISLTIRIETMQRIRGASMRYREAN